MSVDFDKVKKCCFTGYRPAKFPFSVNDRNAEYVKFENRLIKVISSLCKEGCCVFYSGMAMGFDIIAAETVLLLKKASVLPELKLVYVLPFKNQSDNYPFDWKKRYNNIIENADDIVILEEEYSVRCYQSRNIYMVDNCDYVLTWYDGKSGGTQNTLKYANIKQRYIFNINDSEDFGIQTRIDYM